jgi:hypothetical protein
VPTEKIAALGIARIPDRETVPELSVLDNVGLARCLAKLVLVTSPALRRMR